MATYYSWPPPGCGLLCQQVQRVEWELLFDYCHKQATGRV
jgi:hypothetical protein